MGVSKCARLGAKCANCPQAMFYIPLMGGGILGFPIKKSGERVIKICRVKTKKYICVRFAHWQKCVVFEISVVG